MNMLVKNEDQILYRSHLHKEINIPYVDTGNSMTEKEIRTLNSKINCSALLKYRNEVGETTTQIISSLTPEDLKRKIEKNLLRRIILEKAVDKDSMWLIDFWGKKNIAGLLLMPATRHNMVHLNKSMEIKNKIMKVKDHVSTER
jgi:hypothetical protein